MMEPKQAEGWREIIDDLRAQLQQAQKERDNERHDVEMLCRIASEVYDNVTRGRISKPNTEAFEIISVVDELATEERNEAFEEGRAEAEAERDEAIKRGKLLWREYLAHVGFGRVLMAVRAEAAETLAQRKGAP